MASEPKRRHSKGQKRTRRAAINLAVTYVLCKNCGKPTKSHIVCLGCGFYGGKQTKIPQKVTVTKA